jgi:hypothetical protein
MDTKMEHRSHAFLLLLVNPWAQEEVGAFQQKQSKNLLQFPPYVCIFLSLEGIRVSWLVIN